MKHAALLFIIVALASTSQVGAQALALAPAPAPAPYAPLMLAQASPGAAEEDPNRWNFTLSVPIWVPALNGDVTVKGREVEVEQDEGDVVDLLDSKLVGAFAIHFEAQKDRFGILLDGMWVDVQADGTEGTTDAIGTFEGFIGELGVLYAIVAPEKQRGWGAFRLDALGGVRLSALELGIESGIGDASTRRTLYDPYIGGRLELGLLRWLSFTARADVGGFGIDAWPTSDLSFNVDTGLEFHLARWFDLGIGYRWLTYEFEAKAPDSTFDATLAGPTVTLKFNF